MIEWSWKGSLKLAGINEFVLAGALGCLLNKMWKTHLLPAAGLQVDRKTLRCPSQNTLLSCLTDGSSDSMNTHLIS